MASPNTDFGAAGASCARHNASARGRLRHDLVARRLLAELPGAPARVLDVGCGDGEMTLRLARAGHRVTGVDPSADMLAAAAERLAAGLGVRSDHADRVRLRQADLASLPADLGVFDAVCCHGVLMHLDDSAAAVLRLAGLVAPGGVLSVLTRNRGATGVREALRGDYRRARELIEAGAGESVGNLGLGTRGDDPARLDAWAAAGGLVPLAWQGVRVFHDHRDDWRPDPAEYQAALELEWAASSRDPYRGTARLVHTLARRPAHP
ncbi:MULTISPECIES: methyltransferase domain-containing protein [Kitasatospora]|uniref:Putative methyltransferase n=1 Tax=Kitasatospora setae (strain ATCC 33774 / DSM 43861 / JCM 3304 / KCC A-0304 / NBRC 14216 / KM-6054) TaxID=452652 RepID=E4N4N4_KITSK|nr:MULTISPECIES: methyltransferase domain-containing protein [Kitasatospora]BAJ26165.1 putative methyltransferase [Kitasatospora setae KM-6054]